MRVAKTERTTRMSKVIGIEHGLYFELGNLNFELYDYY